MNALRLFPAKASGNVPRESRVTPGSPAFYNADGIDGLETMNHETT